MRGFSLWTVAVCYEWKNDILCHFIDVGLCTYTRRIIIRAVKSTHGVLDFSWFRVENNIQMWTQHPDVDSVEPVWFHELHIKGDRYHCNVRSNVSHLVKFLILFSVIPFWFCSGSMPFLWTSAKLFMTVIKSMHLSRWFLSVGMVHSLWLRSNVSVY